MNIHITTHHLPLTAALSGYAARKISELGNMAADIVAAHVVLRHDPKTHPERRFSASVRLVMRGADLFARDVDGDLYAAIDHVVEKLMSGLRSRKRRRHTWHRLREANRVHENSQRPPHEDENPSH